MKKKYMQPEIEVVTLDSQPILAGSITGTGVSDNNADKDISTLSLDDDYYEATTVDDGGDEPGFQSLW